MTNVNMAFGVYNGVIKDFVFVFVCVTNTKSNVPALRWNEVTLADVFRCRTAFFNFGEPSSSILRLILIIVLPK